MFPKKTSWNSLLKKPARSSSSLTLKNPHIRPTITLHANPSRASIFINPSSFILTRVGVTLIDDDPEAAAPEPHKTVTTVCHHVHRVNLNLSNQKVKNPDKKRNHNKIPSRHSLTSWLQPMPE